MHVSSIMRAFSISVPASSANLGPGFDAVGIALDLRVRAVIEPASRFRLTFEDGPHAPSHDGYAAAILDAMRRVDPKLPRVAMHVENAIPLGKGLGSSAAGALLGLAAAMQARDGALDRDALAHHVCALEGHPDNALAALHGGAIIAASSHAHDCVRIEAPRDLRALVVIPEFDLATREARALLPDRYDRTDVVYQVQRASLLGAALASGSWKALACAMNDRLHQPYRAERIPGLAAALAVKAKELVGIALSGAGPSVLAIVHEGAAWRGIARRLEACFADAGIPARSHRLQFAARGLLVRGLTA
jgi:homoserine kinase